MIPTAVANAPAALEALAHASRRGQPFTLVLLDAHMPGQDGFWLAEQITTRPELAGATIMMLTSCGQYGDAARCRALQIASYLTKPINAPELLQAVRQALHTTTATAATTPVRSAIDGAATIRRHHVLLAEDNVVNQMIAVKQLTRRGHVVTVATTGREALTALDRDTFDLVLMDVQMPEMDGFEATAAIRQRERQTGRHLRIVAMTAHAMTGDRERCLAAGMDDYLSKPLEPTLLFAAVEWQSSASVAGSGQDDE
jgi:CheY-like chemotaxis protein